MSIKLFIAKFATMFLFAFMPLAVSGMAQVHAASTSDIIDQQVCQVDPEACAEPGILDDGGLLDRILTILVRVVGAVSVIVIVIAGIMYAASGGDGNNVKRAKDAIIYAIIGIVVAILAQSIVTFVINV